VLSEAIAIASFNKNGVLLLPTKYSELIRNLTQWADIAQRGGSLLSIKEIIMEYCPNDWNVVFKDGKN
jgi:hypothetical protein